MQRPLTEAELNLTKVDEVWLDYKLLRSTAIQLGPLLVRAGESGESGKMQRMVMHRKGLGVFAVPRFGVFEGTFTHKGPDRLSRLLAQVRWHKAPREMYHPDLEQPMALAAVDKTIPDLCLAEDLVPLSCFAAPDLDDLSRLIILTPKSWRSTLALLGFPPIN